MPQSTIRKTKPKAIPAPIALAGGVLCFHELRSEIMGNSRLLRVWVPPGYDGTGAISYPVLYLNDGQNLFESTTAFAGEHWQVGETASRLIAENKIRPLVIVGIDNTKNRAAEYIPYKSRDPRILRPKGKSYPDFLQREIMPFIEDRYPVAGSPENTGLGGSSLGGLITLYTELAAPNVFGRLLIESPSLFVAERQIIEDARRFQTWPSRVYLGMGTQEVGNVEKDAKILGDLRELETILRQADFDERSEKHLLKVRIVDGATHRESAWAARLPEALEFLYSDRA